MFLVRTKISSFPDCKLRSETLVIQGGMTWCGITRDYYKRCGISRQIDNIEPNYRMHCNERYCLQSVGEATRDVLFMPRGKPERIAFVANPWFDRKLTRFGKREDRGVPVHDCGAFQLRPACNDCLCACWTCRVNLSNDRKTHPARNEAAGQIDNADHVIRLGFDVQYLPET